MQVKTSNTIFYCRKWKECVSFYKNQIGFQETISLDWFVEFKLNEASFLSIADESRASIDSNEGNGVTITLEVVDIEAAHIYLSEAGLSPPPIKDHSWGARVIHIYDPEGNRIEFWSINTGVGGQLK